MVFPTGCVRGAFQRSIISLASGRRPEAQGDAKDSLAGGAAIRSRQEMVGFKKGSVLGQVEGDHPGPGDPFGDECQKNGQAADTT